MILDIEKELNRKRSELIFEHFLRTNHVIAVTNHEPNSKIVSIIHGYTATIEDFLIDGTFFEIDDDILEKCSTIDENYNRGHIPVILKCKSEHCSLITYDIKNNEMFHNIISSHMGRMYNKLYTEKMRKNKLTTILDEDFRWRK